MFPGECGKERLTALRKRLQDSRTHENQHSRRRNEHRNGQVNNHVHSRYSFSPYFPSEAAYMAWLSGLDAVGLIDHDTLAGCEELLAAAQIIGIAATTGCELRVDARGTALEGRQINNPDSRGLLYMIIHGMPHQNHSVMESRLKPIRQSRLKRSRAEVEKLNAWLKAMRLPEIDFDSDVVPNCQWKYGGTITERHILRAMAQKLLQHFGQRSDYLECIEDATETPISPVVKKLIQTEPQPNPHILYDLIGAFKANFLPKFFIQPDPSECPPVTQCTTWAKELGAIPCYAYLGDVLNSPTGDKKAQKFEDDWLEELFEELPQLGFQALSYMPPRNSREQLTRVRKECQRLSLMEISGVDINSPRQSFITPILDDSQFKHLTRNTWALVAHEHLSSYGGPGIFDPSSPLVNESLDERLDIYAGMGLDMNHKNTASILDEAKKEGLCKK